MSEENLFIKIKQNRDELVTPQVKTKQAIILVVDDDALLLDTLEKGLFLNGFQCRTVVSGNIAFELLSKDFFDIMVIDVVLSGVSGFELAAKAKKIRPNMAIIMMTGHIDKFSFEDAINAGASDFIKKPFSIKELITRIEHAKAYQRLQALSLYDELTDLYNRRGFFTLAEQLLKKAKRQQEGLYILYSDVDNLKEINDTLGHQQGDWVLIDAANILKETFRDSDVIARIGGDEFVIMPIETKGDNLDNVANRLQEAIDRYNTKSKRAYKLSMSTGTAYFNHCSPCSIDELLSQADKSMYKQKRSKQTT